jgi:hypothetical protein
MVKHGPVLWKKSLFSRSTSYNELRQNLGENETICFADGVHPTHNTQISYGWIRKGVRKEICSNTGRQRINLSGALDIVEKKVHFQEDLMLNAESRIRFFEKIEQAYPTKKRFTFSWIMLGTTKTKK